MKRIAVITGASSGMGRRIAETVDSFGRFDEGTRTALVSRGMGTHTFHIRIFNRSELLVVTAKPKKPQKRYAVLLRSTPCPQSKTRILPTNFTTLFNLKPIINTGDIQP